MKKYERDILRRYERRPLMTQKTSVPILKSLFNFCVDRDT